jgi:serine/threonine-protein kinase
MGSAFAEGNRTIGWLDLKGNFEEILEVDGSLLNIHLAPGNRYAALSRLNPGSSIEIWMADLQRQTLSILSGFGSDCWGGVFSPDGREYVYTSQDPGFERLYRQAIDGASAPATLLDLQSVNATAYTWSPEGFLLFSHRQRTSGSYEIGRLDLDGGEARPLLTDFNPRAPRLSPDGQWLAYVSDESGRDEIYVRPYPGLDRKWQVSTGGGNDPHWRGDGAQLIFFKTPWVVEGVSVRAENDGLEFSTPFPLASFSRRFTQLFPDADHTRFLAARDQTDPVAEPIRFISNWRSLVEDRAR